MAVTAHVESIAGHLCFPSQPITFKADLGVVKLKASAVNEYVRRVGLN
jgi:hypothetical protein